MSEQRIQCRMLTLTQNCQAGWIVVLLIVCQEYTVPFLEYVKLCIEISLNDDRNRALVVAENGQFPSGSVSQAQILKTFQGLLEAYLHSVSDN